MRCKTIQNTKCQNYLVGEVIQEQIGGLEQCWNKLMEQISMESTKTHQKKGSIWRLCFVVSQGRKNTLRQIQEKYGLVQLGYNIAYIKILFFFFLLTILNQTQYWLILTS